MLIQRVITSIVLMPLVIIGVFYLPKMILHFLIASIIFFAIWEFSDLFNWSNTKRFHFLLGFALIVLFIWYTSFLSYGREIVGWPFLFRVMLYLMVAIGVIWWLVVPYFLWRYEKAGRNCSINPTLLGVLVFIPCLASLFILSGFSFLLLLAIVWSTDIGAYFVGKRFGKYLLAPKISPGKTIEGVFGGILLSLLAAVFFSFLMYLHEVNLSRIFAFLGFSTIVSLWSIVGDLFESMLKRQAGIKDSGKILPGHGGIYDRIDSLISAAPIFCCGEFLLRLM